MQTTALDMVRARAAKPLGDSRDSQARAVARLRLMIGDAKIGTRQWNDLNTVLEDVLAVGKHLDAVGEVLARPVDAAPQPQAEQPGPAKPTAAPRFSRLSLAQVREHAAAGCAECRTLLADLGEPVAVVTYGVFGVRPAADRHDKGYPAANGIGVTDRVG